MKAFGKGAVGEATGFLVSSGDVREAIEVFPGVSGFRENSGEFSACWWFVGSTGGSPALAAPQAAWAAGGLVGFVWVPLGRSPRAQACGGSRTDLCRHSFNLWFCCNCSGE